MDQILLLTHVVTGSTASPPHNDQPMVTRSKSGIHCPKTFPVYEVYYFTKHPCVHYILLQYLLNPLLKFMLSTSRNGRKQCRMNSQELHANDTKSTSRPSQQECNPQQMSLLSEAMS